jgi:hypothetical protein
VPPNLKKRRIRIRNPMHGSRAPGPYQNVTDPEHCLLWWVRYPHKFEEDLSCTVLFNLPMLQRCTRGGVEHSGGLPGLAEQIRRGNFRPPSSPCCQQVFFSIFLLYIFLIFGGLECVGHFFAYVAHFVFLRDVWIRTQRVVVQAGALPT